MEVSLNGKQRLRLRSVWIIVLVSFLTAGCATTKSTHSDTPPTRDKALLEFLEDGVTQKQTVLLKLGKPSYAVEEEKYFFFRIGGDPNEGFYLVEDLGSRETKFSLVLVFDETGLLKKHSLVRIR